MNKYPYKLGIIGTGMIGCSVSLALKKNNHYPTIGYSSGKTANQAKKLNLIDEVATCVEQIMQQAEIIIIATPLLTFEKIIEQCPAPQYDQLVMDCGSVKGRTTEIVKKYWSNNSANFVPCHPIAGLEKSGPSAATENLYDKAKIIITPLSENSANKIQQATNFWQKIGGIVMQLSVGQHDEFLSNVSHLPHLLAFILVEGLNRRHGEECFIWSAGGFKDFTRIASSDPTMWHDICLQNKKYILQAINHYQNDLQALKENIETENSQEIQKKFQKAKTARDRYYQTHSGTEQQIKN